ncbi:MAG: bifunctional phosphopantothenoylcysteine decarboxylase/phosphopantothenate--cysteine ligase CoaBC [Bacteroidota bacterium]
MLEGKKIILGISGSIAAYKAAFLVRLLVKAGAEVRVLMTEAATDFISPLTLGTLAKSEVLRSVRSEAGWNNHVELGLWADAYLIAPATANTLARLANGICDNMLAAVYLSARCPVYLAPAMDVDMWSHPATQQNLDRLRAYGNRIIDVAEGELASGLNGPGRLAEPEDIVARLVADFSREQDLEGQRILITAGPTHEVLDPVRYLGNRSTGRMGIALAEAAVRRGAEVQLVLGPSSLPVNTELVQLTRVTSAQEMMDACQAAWPHQDVAIMAAAVADYRPATVTDKKIKKGSGPLQLELERTADIAASLGQQKSAQQRLIGFALETDNELENARGKLARKNFDFIVLNSLRDAGAGFGTGTNLIRIVDHNKVTEFELKDKAAVAEDILDALKRIL